ncbi:MAG: hypothetical protein WA418_32515 [Bradyrhizobium sp.]
MMLLSEMAKNLLHLLMIMDMGAGMILLVLGFRESFAMAAFAPKWPGLFALRRPTASSYSDEYRTHRRQMFRYGLAFLGTIGIAVLLIGLNNLLFKTPI